MTTLTRRAQLVRIEITEPTSWLSLSLAGLGAGLVGIMGGYAYEFLYSWIATL